MFRENSAEKIGSVDYAESGVRSVENAECGKRGVGKTRSVENAECGKRGVWKFFSLKIFKGHCHAIWQN